MVKTVIWDYDGTLVDTRQKNLNVTKEVVFEVLNKGHEEFSALHNIQNYQLANSKSANWRDLYAGDHETDAHCAFNTNEALRKKRIISIGALYEKDYAIENWTYKPDYIAASTNEIVKIVNTIWKNYC